MTLTIDTEPETVQDVPTTRHSSDYTSLRSDDTSSWMWYHTTGSRQDTHGTPILSSLTGPRKTHMEQIQDTKDFKSPQWSLTNTPKRTWKTTLNIIENTSKNTRHDEQTFEKLSLTIQWKQPHQLEQEYKHHETRNIVNKTLTKHCETSKNLHHTLRTTLPNHGQTMIPSTQTWKSNRILATASGKHNINHRITWKPLNNPQVSLKNFQKISNTFGTPENYNIRIKNNMEHIEKQKTSETEVSKHLQHTKKTKS